MRVSQDILCSIEQLAHDGELHIDVGRIEREKDTSKTVVTCENVDSLGAV